MPVSVSSTWLSQAIKRRNDLKKEGDPKHKTLKVMNNSYYGKISSTDSRLCCPIVQTSIILNIQMSLIHLMEGLEALAHTRCIIVNTDGIVISTRADQKSQVEQVILHWQNTWSFKLSHIWQCGSKM